MPPSRRRLRDKAKGIGKSVAGTVKEKGKEAVETTKRGAREIQKNVKGRQNGGQQARVRYENGQWVVSAFGERLGTFGSKQEAVSAAQTAVDEIPDLQGVSVEDRQQKGGDEPGKFQQFATSFTETVNSKAKQAVEGPEDSESGESGGGPALPGIMGGAAGSDDDSNAPQLAFMGGGGGGDDETGGPFLPGMMDGGQEGGNGENAPFLPGMGMGMGGDDDGGGPFLPGMMGGGGESEGQQGPMLPGMGMGGGGEEAAGPSMPMFGGGQQDGGPQLPIFQDGGPQAPMFGPAEESDDDGDYKPPWML